jgi:hypothetical protein
MGHSVNSGDQAAWWMTRKSRFLLPTDSRDFLPSAQHPDGLSESPIQWIVGLFPVGMKRPER